MIYPLLMAPVGKKEHLVLERDKLAKAMFISLISCLKCWDHEDLVSDITSKTDEYNTKEEREALGLGDFAGTGIFNADLILMLAHLLCKDSPFLLHCKNDKKSVYTPFLNALDPYFSTIMCHFEKQSPTEVTPTEDEKRKMNITYDPPKNTRVLHFNVVGAGIGALKLVFANPMYLHEYPNVITFGADHAKMLDIPVVSGNETFDTRELIHMIHLNLIMLRDIPDRVITMADWSMITKNGDIQKLRTELTTVLDSLNLAKSEPFLHMLSFSPKRKRDETKTGDESDDDKDDESDDDESDDDESDKDDESEYEKESESEEEEEKKNKKKKKKA